jgi:hypothetical protein
MGTPDDDDDDDDDDVDDDDDDDDDDTSATDAEDANDCTTPGCGMLRRTRPTRRTPTNRVDPALPPYTPAAAPEEDEERAGVATGAGWVIKVTGPLRRWLVRARSSAARAQAYM